MRKLTDKEIEDLTNKEGIDKSVVEIFLRNIPLDPLEAMECLVKNARHGKWKRPTILVCLNGIWISTGLPQEDAEG